MKILKVQTFAITFTKKYATLSLTVKRQQFYFNLFVVQNSKLTGSEGICLHNVCYGITNFN